MAPSPSDSGSLSSCQSGYRARCHGQRWAGHPGLFITGWVGWISRRAKVSLTRKAVRGSPPKHPDHQCRGENDETLQHNLIFFPSSISLIVRVVSRRPADDSCFKRSKYAAAIRRSATESRDNRCFRSRMAVAVIRPRLRTHWARSRCLLFRPKATRGRGWHPRLLRSRNASGGRRVCRLVRSNIVHIVGRDARTLDGRDRL
jgi:hypothetical protein